MRINDNEIASQAAVDGFQLFGCIFNVNRYHVDFQDTYKVFFSLTWTQSGNSIDS